MCPKHCELPLTRRSRYERIGSLRSSTPSSAEARAQSTLRTSSRELDVIAHRIERVAAVPAEAFSADCPEYDSACMVIIRLVSGSWNAKSTHPTWMP